MATIEHRLALPQGTRVQDFQFHRVLGHGGFGITYLGWNVALDIPVAIKEYLPSDLAMREKDMSVLPKSAEDDADFHWGLDRFLGEARVLARFKHPNIVQVQHFFQAHGTAYIVMEYVEGETLSDLLKRRGTLTEAELNNILLPLLEGLFEVHEAGILHRDIKPGNILLRSADNSPVLVDFGAARLAVGARSRSVTSVLTPGYAPIEQYSSRGHQGPWTDIYALGSVCYQALTGNVPDEAMDRIRQDPILPVTEAAKGKTTVTFLSAIDWALRVEEADRPQDIQAWRSALLGEETASALVSVGTPTQRRPQSDKTSQVFTRWLWGLAALLIIGSVALWGWLADPALFGGGSGNKQALTAQETSIKHLEKTWQGTERRVVEESLEVEVDRLLSAAEADLKARRLTSPRENNAWERYQKVLKLDPSNPEAVAGMERVIESYMELFGAALEREDFEQAETYLYRVHELHPESPVLLSGKQRLAAGRQERSDRLDKDAGQRQVARLADLERRKTELAIKEFWEEFETSVEREDLDKATDILARIRELNKGEPGLATGEQRLEETKQARAKRLAEQERQLVAALKKLTEDMVEIPSGTFRMGDLSGNGLENERPVRSVTLPAFKMSKFEVTFKQWDICVADGGCQNYTPNDNGWGRDNRPVINVSYYDIQSFILWLNSKTGGGYRLPTESEWEYAARAGSTTEYSWGNSIGYNCANCNDGCDGRWERTAPVGSFAANAWDLHDMHGNVWEWAQDCWNYNYAGAPSDGSAWMTGSCRTSRVVRGGSWATDPRYLRSAYRGKHGRQSRNNGHQGFRLTQDK